MNDRPGTNVAIREDSFSNVPAGTVQRAVFLPTNLKEAIDFAHLMAGGIGVRPWMRNQPSACLMVLQQAMRWGMDPYAISQKCYYQNETLCFEAQLVNAVVNTAGVLDGRLKVEWTGDANGQRNAETLVCRVSGRLKGSEQLFTLEQPLKDVKTRNSPLWQVNPKQQLAYFTTRAWARLYIPEVLMGVYTPDEVEESLPVVTDKRPDAPAAPDRRQFAETAPAAADAAEDAHFEEIEPEKGGEAPETVETGQEKAESAPKKPEKAAKAAVNEPEIPSEPLEWAAWERSVIADVDKAADIETVNKVRRGAQAALDVAPDGYLDRVQDRFADRIVELSGEK